MTDAQQTTPFIRKLRQDYIDIIENAPTLPILSDLENSTNFLKYLKANRLWPLPNLYENVLQLEEYEVYTKLIDEIRESLFRAQREQKVAIQAESKVVTSISVTILEKKSDATIAPANEHERKDDTRSNVPDHIEEKKDEKKSTEIKSPAENKELAEKLEQLNILLDVANCFLNSPDEKKQAEIDAKLNVQRAQASDDVILFQATYKLIKYCNLTPGDKRISIEKVRANVAQISTESHGASFTTESALAQQRQENIITQKFQRLSLAPEIEIISAICDSLARKILLIDQLTQPTDHTTRLAAQYNFSVRDLQEILNKYHSAISDKLNILRQINTNVEKIQKIAIHHALLQNNQPGELENNIRELIKIHDLINKIRAEKLLSKNEFAKIEILMAEIEKLIKEYQAIIEEGRKKEAILNALTEQQIKAEIAKKAEEKSKSSKQKIDAIAYSKSSRWNKKDIFFALLIWFAIAALITSIVLFPPIAISIGISLSSSLAATISTALASFAAAVSLTFLIIGKCFSDLLDTLKKNWNKFCSNNKTPAKILTVLAMAICVASILFGVGLFSTIIPSLTPSLSILETVAPINTAVTATCCFLGGTAGFIGSYQGFKATQTASHLPLSKNTSSPALNLNPEELEDRLSVLPRAGFVKCATPLSSNQSVVPVPSNEIKI